MRSAASRAVNQVAVHLGVEGLVVVRGCEHTSARATVSLNIYPHTGKGPCCCRMQMLLVYGPWSYPVPVVVHEHGGRTEFVVFDLGCPAAKLEAERTVRAALARLANGCN